MATGWEQLGQVVGGGIDRAGAFETGRLRTAQTESALMLARERQLSNLAAEKKAKALDEANVAIAATGVDPKVANLLQNIAIGGYGSDFSAGMTGLKTGQEMDFRNRIADPSLPLGDQIAAEQGITGKVRNPLDMMGSQSYVDLRNLPAPGEEASLYSTPLGEAMIGTQEATTELRNVQSRDPDHVNWGSPSSVGPGGAGREPPKYKYNPNFDPSKPPGPDNLEVIPLTGGAADPDYGSSPLGSIERRFIGRVAAAAENTIDDLEYFMSMSPTASVGRFGGSAGMKGEDTLLGALMYQAKYQMTAIEENEYNAALGGFSEQLRTLESQGVRGAASIANQFDAMRFEPKDNLETRMVKMARVRQTVENGLAPNLANSSLPTRERQYLEGILTRVAKTIPFTPLDVNEWRRAKRSNPNATLGEVVAQRVGEATGAAPAVPAAPGAAPGAAPSPAAPADEGWIDMGNGVRVREKRTP